MADGAGESPGQEQLAVGKPAELVVVPEIVAVVVVVVEGQVDHTVAAGEPAGIVVADTAEGEHLVLVYTVHYLPGTGHVAAVVVDAVADHLDIDSEVRQGPFFAGHKQAQLKMISRNKY